MDITFSCSQCGQNIVIDEAGAGMELPCPGCQKTLVVPSPQPETPVILSQLCPKCERAWPEQERVCDHCGTPLKKEEQVPTLAPVAAEATVTPRIKSPAPRPVTPPRLPAVEEHAPTPAPAPVVAAAPTSGDEDRYECQSSACGETWFESQLRYQDLGRKKVPVCPKCGLGVSKLRRSVSFWRSLPGAFAYPFKDTGIWVLFIGLPLFAFLDFVGKYFWLSRILLLGIFGTLLIHIIHLTTDNENDPLAFPELSGYSEVADTAKQLALSFIVVFLPTLLCILIPTALTFFSIFHSDDEDDYSYSSANYASLTNSSPTATEDDGTDANAVATQTNAASVVATDSTTAIVSTNAAKSKYRSSQYVTTTRKKRSTPFSFFGLGLWMLAAAVFAVISAFYYPMALLGVSMFDSVAGVHPKLIIPAIFKVFLHYLVILVVLGAMACCRGFLGGLLRFLSFPFNLIVLIPVEFCVYYSLIVSARLLGLLYRANSEKFGWFE